ncbi:MAG: DNA repair protein RecN [Deltaproteobacteria bacterium]|nr:MAG: DNA repair protein RecN [Deltaproteobacteria bacterium]
MLSHLSVRNFTLIDHLELPLRPGLTVLSGETGAGKSILFDALGLLFGARASTDTIRAGADEAFVQAEFLLGRGAAPVRHILDEAGLPDPEDTLLLRRTLHRSAPNRVFVNDTPATVSLLQRLVAPLVEMLGQHQHLALLRPEVHRDLLDAFGGLVPLRDELSRAVDLWHEARRNLDGLRSAAEGREQRLDYLSFQIREIEELAIQPGEFDALDAQLRRARNLEKLRDAARTTSGALHDRNDSATDAVGVALAALQKAASLDPDAAALVPRLEEVRVLLDDLAHDVQAWAGDLVSADDLDTMESRHENLRRAFRRFGGDEDTLLARLDEMREEAATLENYGGSLEDAMAREADCFRTALDTALDLDRQRAAAAERFFAQVAHLLDDLAMPHTRLSLQVNLPDEPERQRRKLSRHGLADIEILFSANPGEPPRPLGRIASGGELSRLMLAFKTVLFEQDPVDTYVFDEIDTGLGGAVAEVVGRMLASLADGRQVLCITHLPQIASFADQHFQVSKHVDGDRTTSRIVLLSDEAREEEIARMLGGRKLTDATRAHARDMLRLARTP